MRWRWPGSSSAKPYTQPSAVRWAVDASIIRAPEPSARATASTAAASGRHKNTMSASAISRFRSSGSFRFASSISSRSMSSRAASRS